MRQERRKTIRVPGPFTASMTLGEAPAAMVRIMDLSEGGCFIRSSDEPPPLGRPLTLNVTFPDGATLALTGEALYTRPGEGYVVLFNGLSKATYSDLERTVERLRRAKH
jgi:hypothetical protein